MAQVTSDGSPPPAGAGGTLLVQVYRVESGGPPSSASFGWRLLDADGREVLGGSQWWSDPAQALENAAATTFRLMRQVAQARERLRPA